jgi:hypothetical protein
MAIIKFLRDLRGSVAGAQIRPLNDDTGHGIRLDSEEADGRESKREG